MTYGKRGGKRWTCEKDLLRFGGEVPPITPVEHEVVPMEDSVVFDASNELILNFLMLTLSAKGSVAAWIVPGVTLLLVAFAWRLVRPRK